MAMSQSQISDYINKANIVIESNMLSIVHSAQVGKKLNSLYYSTDWLSAGVDVLTSNNDLTNLQIEIIVQKMIEQGNLNDFNGDPIPYKVVT